VTVAHFPLAELRDALAADGIRCDILSGAQGRSARKFTSGYYQGCQASVVHHTASSGNNPSGDISYILNGQGEGYVVANAYASRAGIITLIASGPTYTEGAGGPRGIIPTDRGNDVCFSLEIGGGLGTPYTEAQCKAVMHFHYHANRIAARVWGWPDSNPWNANRLFAHFEWTSRKIDPKGETKPYSWATGYNMWNMDRFRADVAALNTDSGDDDMTPIKPVRLYDTREKYGKFKAGEVRKIGVLSDRGVISVTAGDATQPGFLAYSPDNDFKNPTSFLNYSAGPQYIANSIPVLAPGKHIYIKALTACHVVIDQYAT